MALRRSPLSLRKGITRIRYAKSCCCNPRYPLPSNAGGQERNLHTNANRFFNVTSKNFNFVGSISAHRSMFPATVKSTFAKAIGSLFGTRQSEGRAETEETSNEVTSADLIPKKELELDDANSETSDNEAIEFGLLDDKKDSNKSPKEMILASPLFKLVMDAPRDSFNGILDKWVKDGNSLGSDEITCIMMQLHKRRRYATELQFSEWLEANKMLDFAQQDYILRLSLIAKVHNIYQAEKYIERIPTSFRTEIIYQTLLVHCVSSFNLKKAEEVFNKITEMGFPLTSFACNQLLVLYKRLDWKKMADVLRLMEKEGIKPSIFTYKLLIDFKGRLNDVKGMEEVVENMKSEGVSPGTNIRAAIAHYYISGDYIEKAECVLREMEGDDIKKNRNALKSLLPLYAAIGKGDDVERLWKVVEERAHLHECLAAMNAFGKLGYVEKAEAIFEHIVKTWEGPPLRCYDTLMGIYADHKLLAKGEAFVKRMDEDGCKIGPIIWHALTKLYLNIGEVEKADVFLQKEYEKNRKRPMFTTYLLILNKYANKGNVDDAERIFDKMRMNRYVGRMGMYQTLLQAYVNSNSPAYGFEERMKADNVYPNEKVSRLIQTTNPFNKNWITQMLD